jgi:hypothetical protein
LQQQHSTGEVIYFNNSADSSDIMSTNVTTTSNQSQASISMPNATLQSNIMHHTGAINFQQRRGSLQLWQFLIALLDEPCSK